ncbi:MAG: hypothetical protein RL154_1519 [Pseudomonadota bacterium]|jgi:hypothetical protein
MYHCNRLFRKIYYIGDVVNFQLAGFAYFLKQQEFDTIKINDEINISTDNMCVFLGLDNAGDDDYQLLTKIKECEIYEFLGTKIYQLKVNIYQDTTTELEIFLYVAEHNIENRYIPKIGDVISCSCWMTGAYLQ